MTQYQRITGKVFGGNATATGDDPQIAQFGSALANTFVGTTDPATIQQLPAWGQGFIGAVTPETQFPALPEMTGAMKVLSHQICGILQQGISTWDSGTIYYTGNFASKNGRLYISQVDENQGNDPETDTTNWQEFSSGGGLEIGDIGISPLGVDEAKGKRRYLNGQIIIQEQYTVFTAKLKSAVALYPTLACSEQDWQTIATMSVGGQVGKFVIDDLGGTIRLPKIIMPIQGLTDLSKLAEIVEAGMPNVTFPATSIGIGGTSNTNVEISGALGKQIRNQNTNSTSGSYYGQVYLDFDASRSSSIYGNSNTVQQEQIQYPYFIQVATGSETEDNITNTIELVNPFVLLESKYYKTEIYNASWLLADGSFNGSSAIHPSTYNALLIEYNTNIAVGTTIDNYTKRGLSVKLSTDNDITDYDFVINQADETFRLPLLNGSETIPNYNAVQTWSTVTNGTPLDLPCNGFIRTRCQGATYVNINQLPVVYALVGDTAPKVALNLTTGILKKGEATPFFDGTMTDLVFIPARGNGALYYYVGEVSQNANLVNVGRIEETKANKTAIDGQWIYTDPSLQVITSSHTLGKNVPSVFDISNILPNDGYDYEILLTFTGKTATTSGATAYIAMGSGVSSTDTDTGNIPVAYVTTQANSAQTFGGSVRIIVLANRKTIYVTQQNTNYNATLSGLRLMNYRRLGKNA